MKTRIRNSIAIIGRGLRKLGQRIRVAMVRLLRLGLALPWFLWQAFKFLLRFLVHLPGRLWRGLWFSIRFVLRLPGRMWRGLKTVLRFIVSLPSRARASLRRLAFALYRVRLGVRERRARLAFWWRSRVFRPRTMSPQAQALVLAVIAALAVFAPFGPLRTISSRSAEAVVAATATPTPSVGLSATQIASAPTRAASLPNATALAAQAAPFGGGGAVAFSLRRDGNTDIYVRKLGDDQLLRLTYHPADDREPVWAPDGETLAFVSSRGKNQDIYRLDLMSGVLIRLTRDPHFDAHPSWSPDGAFIAFESYRSGNLDIFIMSADGSEIHQLTTDPAADFAPAWSPDGRHIAFVSYRHGSKDVFLYPLDAGTESAVVNLTQTPDRDEDAPTWSTDGSRLAFSVGRFGGEIIYITTFNWASTFLDEAQTQLFNPGTQPDWSPDGTSLIYEYRRGGQTHLIADSVTGWRGGHEVFSADATVREPSWSIPTVDPQRLARQRQTAPMAASSVYIEEILPTLESGSPYTIVALKDVNGGDDREFLSDRVNDSFDALRQRVLEETGTDYLAAIGDSFRAITVQPPPGQSPYSWHKAGRAYDLNQGLYEREAQLVEVVREDIGFRTYWRVYLRTARQDGSMGQPVHDAPWDLKARLAGGLAAREGGELKQEVPLGYYVDFTELAADFGWERVPANNSWRHQWAATNWWQFHKTQGLSWLDAMLELYRRDQIEAVFGPLSEGLP